jgi:hypothetical protein
LSRLLLEEHTASPPTIVKKLSELQASSASQMIASATLTADEQAELASMIVAVPWANEADIGRILGAFTAGPALPVLKRRRSQQDFSTVHHYLTTRMWDAMLDATTPPDTKLTALLGHCMKLGMRCPTEPSIKWVCSLWLVCCTDPVEIGRMDVISKVLKFKTTKLHFDSFRNRHTIHLSG